jgi:hypothetical protein
MKGKLAQINKIYPVLLYGCEDLEYNFLTENLIIADMIVLGYKNSNSFLSPYFPERSK